MLLLLQNKRETKQNKANKLNKQTHKHTEWSTMGKKKRTPQNKRATKWEAEEARLKAEKERLDGLSWSMSSEANEAMQDITTARRANTRKDSQVRDAQHPPQAGDVTITTMSINPHIDLITPYTPPKRARMHIFTYPRSAHAHTHTHLVCFTKNNACRHHWECVESGK